ncbi:MAG: RDD family protein [Verrucomicrobiota bacterium]
MQIVELDQMRIRTPEGVEFALPLAGPVSRMLAVLLDTVILIGVNMVLSQLLQPLFILNPDMARLFTAMLFFLLGFAYFIVQEWQYKGQTLGKRLMRIRVMDEQGLRLQFSQVTVRNLFRVLDAFPLFYLVGGMAVVLNRHGKRLGDLVANTIVVKQVKLEEPEMDQLQSAKYNSFKEHPHLVARLKQRVSPAEATLALDAVMRRTEFEDRDRVRLFADLAEHFRRYRVFPEESKLGLTDEQYVRNLVEVLFHK